MENLKSLYLVVYLKISYEELCSRLGDVVDRGVVLKEGMTLEELYNERVSYFERYADIIIDEEGKELGAVVDELREIMEKKDCGASSLSSMYLCIQRPLSTPGARLQS